MVNGITVSNLNRITTLRLRGRVRSPVPLLAWLPTVVERDFLITGKVLARQHNAEKALMHSSRDAQMVACRVSKVTETGRP